MKKVLIFDVLILTIALAFALPAFAEECKKVIISGSPKYPPFCWQDKDNPDKLTGIMIEIAERAFREMGIATEVRYKGPWKRTLKNAEYGTVDILAGLYFNDERSTFLDYVSPPVMFDKGVVFVMKGQSFRFEEWDDLVGMTGGAILGDSRGKDFDIFEKEKLRIERVSKVEFLFKKLEAGRNRYALYGLYSGLAKAEELGFSDKLEALPLPISEEGMFMAFSKKSPCKKHIENFGKIIRRYAEQKLGESLSEKYLKLWREQIAR